MHICNLSSNKLQYTHTKNDSFRVFSLFTVFLLNGLPYAFIINYETCVTSSVWTICWIPLIYKTFNRFLWQCAAYWAVSRVYYSMGEKWFSPLQIHFSISASAPEATSEGLNLKHFLENIPPGQGFWYVWEHGPNWLKNS